MANHDLARLLEQVRTTVDHRDVCDADLLERFLSAGDEAAFELLVWRHGRLVHGVCRRILDDLQDAEDAFQATFLTLACKAGSIGKREALASWLYKVAYRAALTARTDRSRRTARERPIGAADTVPAPPEPGTRLEDVEVRAVLDEEVSRLPERFRAPMVLCYVEGKTVAEAAQQLGCSRGTVASRLARARQRLRGRLTRRGLTVPAGTVAALAAAGTAAPAALVRSTVRAALPYAAGRAGSSGIIPARAAVLAGKVLKGMFMKKLKVGVTMVVALAGILLAGGSLAVQMRAGAAPEPKPLASAPNASLAEAKDKAVPAAAAPIPVTVSQPLRRAVAPYEDFTGRLEAVRSVKVRPRLSGTLLHLHVKEGADVKVGEPLFEVDPRPCKAALAQAEATVASADARHKFTIAERDRAKRLLQSGAVPQQIFDELQNKVAQAEAALQLTRVNLDKARLDLAATLVTAPVAGRVGTLLANPGDQVSSGPEQPTVVITLTVLNPMGLRFEMDERNFLRYQRLLRAGEVKEAGSPLHVALVDEKGFPHAGVLGLFDSQINPATSTVTVHGILPNLDKVLLPGMFARVRMPFGKPRPVLEVHEAAVRTDQGKHYLLVVDAKNVVEVREVKLGERDGDMRVIGEGLNQDDWFVVGPARPLRRGDRVAPRRETPPDAPGAK